MKGRFTTKKGLVMAAQITAVARDLSLKLRNRHLDDAFRVRSHLTTAERVTLSRLATGRAIVCEIGSYIGASACCFAAEMKRAGYGTVFCIDTWNNNAMSEGSRDTYAEFRKNTQKYVDFIVPVRGFSSEVAQRVASCISHVDLLFIDGDHSYDGVKADWNAYSPFLKPGSVVVFHDCGWAEGVKQVIAEHAKPLVGSFESLPNMWWGVVKD
jgi:predicted O-methyltransferase YrrM